jgi:vacuolar-type H+-ATPase subunit I/STV1
MTLLERCAQIRQELVRIESLESASRDAERDRSRHFELEPLRKDLEGALAQGKVLREAGISFAAMPANTKLLSSFEDYRRSLDEPDAAKRNVYGTFKTALATLTESSVEVVKKTIDGLAIRNSDVDEAALKPYEDVSSLKSKVAEARQKRMEYASAASARHKSLDELRNFLQRRAELLSLAEELKHEHLPPEVTEFFRAVHGGKATIFMLTDSVRKWLETHDQLKDFRITLPLR